ncbi:MAG TPA: tetratricopeptide repeat protein [Rhizomicrobium sp.]|nr:tetratricopeptide repeat protein [Rhizomicrobium sp.]
MRPASPSDAAYQCGLTLSAKGRHLEAIGQFEQALAGRPDDPRVLFALGNTARALGLAAPAEQFYRQVLALEPERLEAMVNLANLLRAGGQFDAAIALLEPALARMPESPELNLTFGSALREKGDRTAAIAFTRAALAASPDYAPALGNLADLLSPDWPGEARTLYDRAIKAAPKNAQLRLNRAILHLANGDLKQGWRDYAARLEVPGKFPASALRLPAWTGATLARTRLLVRAEQGIGDQILFASLIPDLAARAAREGGSVVLECEKRLAPLFARSFPDVVVRPAVITTAEGAPFADYAWLKSAGGANAAIPMGSLPRYLRSATADFPKPHAFLAPDAQERARWKSIFGCRAIGLNWRSGKMGGHRAIQYAPLEVWGAFLKDLSGTPVCVQYDALPDEIAALEQMSGRQILVPEGIDQKNELDRTCALISALDVVISAPTAVSWLAAGAGVKTLKILYDMSWTALGQVHEPFAPACVCVMPDRRGDWSSAFSKAKMLIAPP